jgi:hypothetical protein
MNKVAVGIIVILLIGLAASVYHDETEGAAEQAKLAALAEIDSLYAPKFARITGDRGLVLKTEAFIQAILDGADSTEKAVLFNTYVAFKDSLAAAYNTLLIERAGVKDSIRAAQGGGK